jgi:hypothetical protein
MGWTMINIFMVGLPWLFCKMFGIKTPPERALEMEDLVFPFKIRVRLRPVVTPKQVARVLYDLFPYDHDEREKAETFLLRGDEFVFIASDRQYRICLNEEQDSGVFSKVSANHSSQGHVLINGEKQKMWDYGYCPEHMCIMPMYFGMEGPQCTGCETHIETVMNEMTTNADVRRIEKLMASPKGVKAAEQRAAAKADLRSEVHRRINERDYYH